MNDAISNGDSAAKLLERMVELSRRAAAVNALNPFSAYRQLSQISQIRDEVANQLDLLHAEFRKQMNGTFSGPGFALSAVVSIASAKGLSELLQIERAFHDIGATIDRKHAYAFGYVSLYVALASLLLGVFGLA